MHRILLDDTINNAVNKINSDNTKPLDTLIGEPTDTTGDTVFGKFKTDLNSTIGTADSRPLDELFNAEIKPLSEGLMIPKFTKAIIASGSFTIPKDGTYKIIACGAGGLSLKGGGGCAIDQRDYVAGDVLTLTASGSASAICAARSLSITANGTTTSTGSTASGGNVANHTGGTSSNTSQSMRDSLGCGAGGLSGGMSGGNGGIIGGDGYGSSVYGHGGSGGIIGGNAGYCNNSGVAVGATGGNSDVFGGNGGDNIYPGNNFYGGAGGSGMVGGKGGNHTSVSTATSLKHFGGNGGNGTLIGGDGGTSAHSLYGYGIGGFGGNGGVMRGGSPILSAGGLGGNMGMSWAIPFKEVLSWTKGNAIIFIEEV